MSFAGRTYTIVGYPPSPEVWDAVIESEATCRRSLDGTLVLLKWEGPLPGVLSGSTVYSSDGISEVLATPAWRPPDPPPPEDDP